jgi:signal transduction histidine kinase
MREECEFGVPCPLIKSIIDNLDMYCVYITKNGEILYHSKKIKEYFKGEIIGKKLSNLISKLAYEEIRKLILEVLFTNNQLQQDILFKDDKIYRVIALPIPNNQNETIHIVLTAYNASNTLKIKNENDELKKKLDESNSIKSIFLSNISHELKTPMSAIIGFSELLLNSDNQKEKFLKSINSNAKYLNELLDNILDYSKLESDEFDILYENFSLNELLNELFDILDDINYKKNLNFVKLEIEKGKDKKIICDYLRLKQVLFNIISNSIKFTEHGYIKIKFEELEDSIIFTVKDTGIGIPSDKIKLVFDRFWQYDSSSTKKHKGVGLGLSISKSIIEMLNGDIWVESEVGKGTTFFVKIPLEEIKQNVIVKKKKDITFYGKTILVIDELPSNYSMLSIYLNSLHIDMITADNGKDAIKIFKKQKEKIDLIIFDVVLPDINGVELAIKFREIDTNCKIISKSSVEFLNENINFHLKKPFSKDKLVILLKELWQK